MKPDQIRTIIGPGGKMIRAIVDQTGASIDVEDDGTVNVSSADSAAVLKALEIIKSLTTEPEIGEVYEGTVKRIEAVRRVHRDHAGQGWPLPHQRHGLQPREQRGRLS